MSSKTLIIPAAGSGTRMQSATAKPFIRLAGRPILQHTLTVFAELKGLQQIIIATSHNNIDACRKMAQQVFSAGQLISCIQGGDTRQQSVFKALQEHAQTDLILIHDAVRPFISPRCLATVCDAAEQVGAAAPGMRPKDTIKRVDANNFILETPDRNTLRSIQTPQVFRASLIKRAHQQAARAHFSGTDDASLVEALGEKVQVMPGEPANLKITYPADLEWARQHLQNQHADE